jgi:transcriptional regulator with XRE-family HTH domain
VPDDSFSGRLRRERERRQIALSSIAANTKISAGLFAALERGDVSRWPTGIYRRSFIRAYATAIGLDPEATAREFFELFPDPDRVAAAAATAPPKFPATATPTVLRLTLGDPGSPFSAGRLLPALRDRCAAVACDAGVVTAIAAAVFAASGTFWQPLGIATLAYYLVGILLLGNTPGVALWAPPTRRPAKTSFVATLKSRIARSTVAWFTGLKRSVSVPASSVTDEPDPRRPRSRSPA